MSLLPVFPPQKNENYRRIKREVQQFSLKSLQTEQDYIRRRILAQNETTFLTTRAVRLTKDLENKTSTNQIRLCHLVGNGSMDPISIGALR